MDRFVRQDHNPSPGALLPVLQDLRQCRKWAGQVEGRIGYQPHLPSEWSRRLDDICLHKLWGPLIFMLVVGAVFQTVFGLGQPMSNAFQDLLTKLGLQAATFIPAGILRSLLLDGLWKGVSSVLVFLPQILLLFFLLDCLKIPAIWRARR